MVTTPAPEPDLAWCHDAVQGVSRTFASTVDVPEEPMVSHIRLGCLLCRVADTIEGAGRIPPETQANLLRTFDAALDPASDATMMEFRAVVDDWLPASADRNADWSVVAQSPTIWATFTDQPEAVQTAIRQPAREMIDGMALFVERHAGTGGLRIDARSELERYCYYAAGTVGRLIANLPTRGDVSGERAQTLYDTADEFGLLLQLVNVSKDVYDGYTVENNVYLPAEWLADEGITQAAILRPDNRNSAAKVVERLTAHAATLLDDAQAYIEAMSPTHGNTIGAWSIPYLLSAGSIRELSTRPEDVLTGSSVKMSRREVFVVMDAASTAGRDSAAEFRETIARKPHHHALD